MPKIPADLIEKLDQANLSKVEQLDGLSEKDLMDIEGVTKEEADYLIKAIKNVTKGN